MRRSENITVGFDSFSNTHTLKVGKSQLHVDVKFKTNDYLHVNRCTVGVNKHMKPPTCNAHKHLLKQTTTLTH